MLLVNTSFESCGEFQGTQNVLRNKQGEKLIFPTLPKGFLASVGEFQVLDQLGVVSTSSYNVLAHSRVKHSELL